MENNMSVIYKEIDIFKSIQYYRLKKELELLEKDKSLKEENIKKDNKFMNFIKGNESKSKKLSDLIDKVSGAIHRFEMDNASINYNLYFENKLRDAVNEVYLFDKYGLNKILFSISIALDNSYEYRYEKEELTEVSMVLFNDNNKIINIKDKLEDHYKHISTKSLTDKQKGILMIIGASGIALATALPIFMVGGLFASAAVTAEALAFIGFGDMQLGIGIAALAGIIAGSIALGSTYASFKMHNLNEAKKAFKALNGNEAALLLAIKTVLVDEANRVMPSNDFKEYFSEMLETIDTLKSDTEYMLYVERDSVDTNKDKMEVFYKWNKQLIKVLDL